MSSITYRTAWRAISARVRGLEKAAALHASFLGVNSQSAYGAEKDLSRHCGAVWADMKAYSAAYAHTLPPTAVAALNRFGAQGEGGQQIEANTNGDARMLRNVIVKLIAFESEIAAYLDDPLERVRSASELAFMHLQRQIAADKDYRAKWLDAFAKNEPQCEKLGGVHLLWHGIWAFKVDAAGGKTDLVYQEPLAFDGEQVALGVVLTEWKKADDDGQDAFVEAKMQADQYSSGVLAGVELTSHRYLVVVTKKQIRVPADIIGNGTIYRHINIAVDPDTPSLVSKRR